MKIERYYEVMFDKKYKPFKIGFLELCDEKDSQVGFAKCFYIEERAIWDFDIPPFDVDNEVMRLKGGKEFAIFEDLGCIETSIIYLIYPKERRVKVFVMDGYKASQDDKAPMFSLAEMRPVSGTVGVPYYTDKGLREQWRIFLAEAKERNICLRIEDF